VSPPYVELPKLTDAHDCSQFDSGAPELDEWLRESAITSAKAGNASVFVATSGGTRVVAYYALASCGVANDPTITPGAVRRNAPDPVPCLLLARLAVDREFHGRRIDTRLFQDVLWRAERVSRDIGFRALLIHARSDEALSFYLSLTGSFRQSPSDHHHLFLPLRDLRTLVRH
jgi:GNAT superfamily N-acetyltransferase